MTQCRRIPDDDYLFRHSVHPTSFRGQRFASEKWLKIYDEPDGSLLASLAWERFVPTNRLVHSYGCRLALGMNTRDLANGRKTASKKVYCGAYVVRADAVRALVALPGLNEILSAEVVHHIEQGEIAHADLRIVLRPEGGFSNESTKTAIIDRLWNACYGPMRHVCDCDKAVTPHPSLMLQTAPRGLYSDDRSHIVRLWSLVRYWVCKWRWQRSLRNRS
jgi:hypothetical protein